jgi:two-component system chemotaxis response regulator CheB
MTRRNIIAIGASAGGVEALSALAQGLPPDLDASLFVVLHIPPYCPSSLPRILTECGPLKAQHAVDGEQIKRGRIYVAPPDHHLLVENDRTIVRRGPKENRFRPSVDALFRSVAYGYGSRVIGIVLSGALDDGTSGLWSIQRLGGATVAQSLEEASQPSMPRSAIEGVSIDHVCMASPI